MNPGSTATFINENEYIHLDLTELTEDAQDFFATCTTPLSQKFSKYIHKTFKADMSWQVKVAST